MPAKLTQAAGGVGHAFRYRGCWQCQEAQHASAGTTAHPSLVWSQTVHLFIKQIFMGHLRQAEQTRTARRWSVSVLPTRQHCLLGHVGDRRRSNRKNGLLQKCRGVPCPLRTGANLVLRQEVRTGKTETMGSSPSDAYSTCLPPSRPLSPSSHAPLYQLLSLHLLYVFPVSVQILG